MNKKLVKYAIARYEEAKRVELFHKMCNSWLRDEECISRAEKNTMAAKEFIRRCRKELKRLAPNGVYFKYEK